jgi:hypothetical protein
MVVWVINAAYGMGFRPVQNQNDRGWDRWLISNAHSAKEVPNAAPFQKYYQSRTLETHRGHPKGPRPPQIPLSPRQLGQRFYRFAAVMEHLVARFRIFDVVFVSKCHVGIPLNCWNCITYRKYLAWTCEGHADGSLSLKSPHKHLIIFYSSRDA